MSDDLDARLAEHLARQEHDFVGNHDRPDVFGPTQRRSPLDTRLALIRARHQFMMSNGRDEIRPSTGAGLSLLQLTTFNLVDQATPDTVYQATAGPLSMGTASAEKRVFVKIPSGLPQGRMFVFDFAALAVGDVGAGSLVLIASGGIDDYDPTTLTWNNKPTFSNSTDVREIGGPRIATFTPTASGSPFSTAGVGFCNANATGIEFRLSQSVTGTPSTCATISNVWLYMVE